MKIVFTVDAVPLTQKRHKHRIVKPHFREPFVGTYDPSKKEKEDFLYKCIPMQPEVLIDQPAMITLIFILERPKSHYYKDRLKPSSPVLPHLRGSGDLDNYEKFVLDALQYSFFKDDSIFVKVNSTKLYETKDRKPVTYICIETIDYPETFIEAHLEYFEKGDF